MFKAPPQLVQLHEARVQALFGNDPSFLPMSAPDLWAFSEPCVYTSRSQKCTITCPVGAITDFASTPKWLQWLPFLDTDGVSRLAAALHDTIYKLGRERGKDFADAILREACLDLGMSGFQAGAFYQGVHLCGTGAWAEDGANTAYGEPARANFIDREHFETWQAGGATIYSA